MERGRPLWSTAGMFTSVLVANRGEIAVRICRTLREMGIHSVVVASIPDRASLAVRSADSWVLLEGYSAAESYLDAEAVIAAAKAQGCEAIHPGYGFLSERADFAERCAAEGLTFIGPPPPVLRALGDKSAARQLAVANGVPVVPGYDGPDGDATLLVEAVAIGVPIMVKARGGGGGRGMREVHDLAELPEAIESARREALSAFGDGGLLLEKLVTAAHHVEVQVLADAHGNVVHLGERDCSVQRRRQKLIEETPSPIVDDALRARLTGAALTIVRAANYVNAGTVEFLVGEPDDAGERPFYFLEVNPRLQVEHPVTEMVTGLDLVELQVRVAAGEPLPFRQAEVQFSGHAIELRVNAEDPWDGFRPASGRIETSRLDAHPYWPGDDERSAWRADLGYEEGDTVPSQYDSLLGKLICHAPGRDEALTMAASWERNDLRGLRTNLSLLHAVVRSKDFANGRSDIMWLERQLGEFKDAVATSDRQWLRRAITAAQRCSWIGAGPFTVWLDDGAVTREANVLMATRWSGRAWLGGGDGHPFRVTGDGAHGRSMRIEMGPEAFIVPRHWLGDHWLGLPLRVEDDIRVVQPPPLPRRVLAAVAGVLAVVAPLPGTVAALSVAEGDIVAPGQLLCLLEAMKMEHRITAAVAGTVKRVAVAVRDVVREGDILVELG